MSIQHLIFSNFIQISQPPNFSPGKMTTLPASVTKFILSQLALNIHIKPIIGPGLGIWPQFVWTKKERFLCTMQMQIWQFPISLTKWEENREPQLLLAATSDHENEDNAGGWWQRDGSARTWVLVDNIELLIAFCLEHSPTPVFQLESLQVYLVFNPLWVGISVTV